MGAKERKDAKREAARQGQLVSDWNTRNPVGAAVTVRLDNREPVETRTRSAAELLGGHTAVVWLEGISGCYLLERCTPRATV